MTIDLLPNSCLRQGYVMVYESSMAVVRLNIPSKQKIIVESVFLTSLEQPYFTCCKALP